MPGASDVTMSLSSEDVQLLKRWMGMQAPQDKASGHDGSRSKTMANPSTTNSNTNNSSHGQAVSINLTNGNVLSVSHQTAVGDQPFIIKGSSRRRQIIAKSTSGTSIPITGVFILFGTKLQNYI